MTIKNFSIEQGLDLNGLVLTNGNGELLVNGNAISVDLTGYATEDYVDALAQGLDVKASVKVATTASLVEGGGPLGGGTNPWTTTPGVSDPTIDGVTLSVGDRVLVKNDYDGSNGIYEVTSPVANYYMLERTADGIIDDTLTKGAFVFVEGGSNMGKGFVASIYPAMPPLMEYAQVFWSQFSEAGSYISSVGTSGGLDVSSGTLSINKGLGIATDEYNQLYTTLIDLAYLRNEALVTKYKKVVRTGLYDGGTSTATVTIPNYGAVGEFLIRYGLRVSKVVFSLDQWAEYGIVDYDNQCADAVLDIQRVSGEFVISINCTTSGNPITVVADFIEN